MIFSNVQDILTNLFLKQKRYIFSYKIKLSKGILNKFSVFFLYFYQKIFKMFQTSFFYLIHKVIFYFYLFSKINFLYVSLHYSSLYKITVETAYSLLCDILI